jgi:hypothetical protein
MMFEVDGVRPEVRRKAVYVAAALHGVAREEYRGRWPQRLLEPGRASWVAFRGRLDERALVQLLLEDAAVTHPHPFRREGLFDGGEPVDVVPVEVARRWVETAPQLELALPSAEYVLAQARMLGVTTKIARSDLPVMHAHHRALELPGTGGQLAHHALSTHAGLTIRDNFVVACGTSEELILAGLIATELGVGGELPLHLDPLLDGVLASRASFDFVFGLSPEKGGPLPKARLLELFPSARVVLV